MQATRRAAPILLAACVALVGSAAGALDDPAARTRVTQLENGLTVLTLVDDTTPVVSFQMWVHVGSRDETRYTGLAHLFEHMMFAGSKNVGPEQHAQLIERARRRGERVHDERLHRLLRRRDHASRCRLSSTSSTSASPTSTSARRP